jgi:hypothetical protein
MRRGILHILWRGMWAFQKKHPKVVRFLELHHHAPYLDEESRRVEERILAPLRAFVEDRAAAEADSPPFPRSS